MAILSQTLIQYFHQFCACLSQPSLECAQQLQQLFHNLQYIIVLYH